MIDLNKAPAYFSVLHHDTGSHDESIRRLAAHYYQRGIEEGHGLDGRCGDYHNGGMTIAVGSCAGIVPDPDDIDLPRLGCHTSWPHQEDRVGEPCLRGVPGLPACAGCGRIAE